MGIFSSIKDAIFGKEAKAQEKPAPQTGSRTGSRPVNTPIGAPDTAPSTSAQTQVINVENNLDSMPGADRLNWRTSIVDLMKLLGIESSYENRKALAGELGRGEYSGTAADNVWLHRKTMQELSRNGGKVPAEFLD